MTKQQSQIGKRRMLLLAATSMFGFAAAAPALAQEATAPAASSGPLEEIIVTAQKRAQNLQDVPISVQALGQQQLEQLNLTSFTDYAQYLPSLSYAASYGPGYNRPFIRGVASGENGNHSGSQPSVGAYLDEQPITTITGNLDLHLYDVSRVEVLAGPQGTLYGASSESGTIRIITNQPDTRRFSASLDGEANTVAHGDWGETIEGYVNIPLSNRMAVRLVGWQEHDGGYIDNVHGTRTFPTAGLTQDNANRVEDNYNTVDTAGARMALGIDLNENWTITPQIMGQRQASNGIFGDEPNIGDYQVTHWLPEFNRDSWIQSALTIHGTISDFDVVLTGAHLSRSVNSGQDYADYGYFYDVLYNYVNYDNSNTIIDPSQYVEGHDRYANSTYEFRVASPTQNPLRFIAGLYHGHAEHRIHQRYIVQGLRDSDEVPGWTDTIWLTQQLRVDEEYAAFGEVSYDFSPQLTGTLGTRIYRTAGSLEGFFGYGAGYGTSQGEATCFEPATVEGAPCNDLNKSTSETGSLYRANLQYRFDNDRMIYATFSQGFRPGGINRRGSLPPYESDHLDNYEIGWKTEWADGRMRWNGAIYMETWRDFQFAFLGANGLTQIQNAGSAEIRGIESDVTWAPIDHLTITGSASLLHGEMSKTTGFAPEGTQLPTSPEVKADLTARYEFPLGNLDAFLQGSVAYQGESTLDLRPAAVAILGDLPAYTLVNISAGVSNDDYRFSLFIDNLFDEHAITGRYVECAVGTCGGQPYNVIARPMTFGVRVGRNF